MKNLSFAAVVALLSIGMSACQSKELTLDTPDVAESCEIACRMSATMPELRSGGDPETRSSLESVVRVRWNRGDELSVINLTTGKQLGGCIKADNDGANSTFSPYGLVGSITAGDQLVFLLDNAPEHRSAGEKAFEPFTMDFSSQKGNSNEVPIVVYANYTATENGTINAVNPEFNFLMGYVQLAVSALPASTSVTELGIENLNTKCQFSISNHSFVATPQNGNITLSEAFTANSKGTNTRYFSCFTSPAQGVARNAHITANSQGHTTAWLKAALSAGYYYQAVATGFTNENISFMDNTFKSYCVSHYDKNGDGEVSFAEAAAVTSFEAFTSAEKSALKEVFELPYFFKGERIPNFEGCTALKQIVLPGTLPAIQENAFKGCTGLEVITIPSTVTTIGEGAFEGCISLERFDGTMASSDRRYLVKNGHVLAFAPAGLTEITIPDGVTTIDAGVFANNTTLKTIYFPAELTTVEARAFKGCTAIPIIRFRANIANIGEEAFKGCSALRSVYSDAVTPPTVGTNAFANCHSSLAAHVTAGNLSAYEASPAWTALNVTSGQPWNEIWYTTTDGSVIDHSSIYGLYDIGELLSNSYVDGKGILSFNSDVTQISPYSFMSQTRLATIELPESIISIRAGAFSCCGSLTNISLPASITTIEQWAFDHCGFSTISLPESIISIGDYAFSNCNSLTNISFSEGITSIGTGAFYQCSSLTTVTFPNSVQLIGDKAFLQCTSLTTVSLPEGITSIENETFLGCSALATITFHDGLLSIGESAFNQCTSLSTVSLPESIISLGVQAFSACIALTSITLPNGITSIGDYAFSICSSLTSITFPTNLTSIGCGVFQSCTSLTSISIPNTITSIGDSSFSSCYALSSVTLPSTIEAIGSHQFENCYELESIFIKATTPPSGTPAVSSGCTIYVPSSSVNAYREAWPDLAGIITGYDFD